MSAFLTNMMGLGQRLRDTITLLEEAASALPEIAADQIKLSLDAWLRFLRSEEITKLSELDQDFTGGLPPIITDLRLAEMSAVLDRVANNLGSPNVIATAADELDALLAATAADYRSQVFSLDVAIPQATQLVDFLSRTYSEITNQRLIEQAHKTLSTAQAAATQATEAAASAEGAAENAQQASGVAAESVLAAEYGKYCDKEATSANWFRGFTIVLIAAGIALGYFLPHPDNWAVADAVYRIAILAGIFGLAGYLGRQAHHHRELSTWADAIRVQLLTFEAFLDPIRDPAIRDQLRVLFAGRVFGPSPQMKGEPSTTPSAEILDTLTTVVAKAAGPKQ